MNVKSCCCAARTCRSIDAREPCNVCALSADDVIARIARTAEPRIEVFKRRAYARTGSIRSLVQKGVRGPEMGRSYSSKHMFSPAQVSCQARYPA